MKAEWKGNSEDLARNSEESERERKREKYERETRKVRERTNAIKLIKGNFSFSSLALFLF